MPVRRPEPVSSPLLILVKHCPPDISPAIPACEWLLSEEGRSRCRLLADRLRAYAPAYFLSSREPKAIQTAQITARLLGLEHRTCPGLHEHQRASVPLVTQAEFQARVAAFFAQPGRQVYGDESADTAFERFSAALDQAIQTPGLPGGNLAVVTHGTVLSLWLSRRCALPAYPLWQSLGLPAFAVVTLPDFKLLDLVQSVLQS